MPSYFLKKSIHFLALMVAVTALAFTLVNLSPVDPVSAYIGTDTRIGPEQREAIAQRFGLDKSPVERFGFWLNNIIQGDWGESLIFREPVTSVIGKRFWPSLALMGGAWFFSGMIGFTLGLAAGFKQNSWLDRLLSGYAYFLASTPTFWVGILLLMLFSVKLGLTPICCAWPVGLQAGQATLGQKLHHLLLPMMTLSIVGISAIILHTRQKVIDLMKSDFSVFAQAQGVIPFRFLLTQGLKHVSIPAITVHLASFGELFGGSILAEQVFSYPGLGQAAVMAGIRGDTPLLLGITICSALFIYFGNTMADLSYRLLDPRINLEGVTVS